MSNRLGSIVAELRTKNGFLVNQTVRLEDNGSVYTLRGSDMVDDAELGKTLVTIRTFSDGTGRLVTVLR